MASKVCPTPGFEKLLVATDGSEFSKAAVQEAITIASACSSILSVLLVFEVSAEVELWDVLSTERLEKQMRNYLEGIKAKAVRAGVKCDVILHLGDEPYKLIVAEAKKGRSAPSSWAATDAQGSRG